MRKIVYKKYPYFEFLLYSDNTAELFVAQDTYGVLDRRTGMLLAIDKWQAIVKFMENHPDTELVTNDLRTCPLCFMYFDYDDCEGCPIRQSTGKPYCEDTPYKDSDDRTLADAQAEVKFLKTLAKLQGYL